MTETHDMKPRSREVTDGIERAAARGMLRAPKLSRWRVGIWQSINAKPHSRSRSTSVTKPTLDASVARLNIDSPKNSSPIAMP